MENFGQDQSAEKNDNLKGEKDPNSATWSENPYSGANENQQSEQEETTWTTSNVSENNTPDENKTSGGVDHTVRSGPS